VVPIPIEMLKAFEAAFGKDVFPDAMHERTAESPLASPTDGDPSNEPVAPPDLPPRSAQPPRQ